MEGHKYLQNKKKIIFKVKRKGKGNDDIKVCKCKRKLFMSYLIVIAILFEVFYQHLPVLSWLSDILINASLSILSRSGILIYDG